LTDHTLNRNIYIEFQNHLSSTELENLEILATELIHGSSDQMKEFGPGKINNCNRKLTDP